jgi:presqualene diphosphate synthase
MGLPKWGTGDASPAVVYPLGDMAIETTATTSPDALAYVESVVRLSGSSFSAAMRRLPADKRNAMFAVYAFCRQVDDIADEPGEETDKLARLAEWRSEIEGLYAGHPRHLVGQALAAPVVRFSLNKQDFLAVVDGMEMDAGRSLRIVDWDQLGLYCDRVACAVGRLSNRVFGIDDETGTRVARALGEALQLTNILRDVGEDARSDRLYLPQDLLRSHGITETDAGAVLAHPNLPGVCAEMAVIAQGRFDEAAALLAMCNRRQMRPAIMMMEAYRRLFLGLSRRGWQDLDQPVKLSWAEKLWVLLRYGLI